MTHKKPRFESSVNRKFAIFCELPFDFRVLRWHGSAMKVKGVEITEAQLDACITRMKRGPFKIADIAIALKHADYRGSGFGAADRILQKFRRAGVIDVGAYVDLPFPQWKWIGK